MNVTLPPPDAQYNPQNEAQTRRMIAQALASVPSTETLYTVATLPTAPKLKRAFVSDAAAPTFLGVLTGGGAVVCPVFFNGLAWVPG